MILADAWPARLREGAPPRVSGDDPANTAAFSFTLVCPPRERG